MTTLGALVAFPLKIEWDQLHPPVTDPFPTPVATTRDGHVPPAQPAPVVGLVAAVEREGWSALVQHSAGHVPHATHGRPGAAPVEHWAVRMHRGHRGALAMRKGAAWEFFYVWSKDGFIRTTALGEFHEIRKFGAELDALPATAERRWGPVV